MRTICYDVNHSVFRIIVRTHALTQHSEINIRPFPTAKNSKPVKHTPGEKYKNLKIQRKLKRKTTQTHNSHAISIIARRSFKTNLATDEHREESLFFFRGLRAALGALR